MTSHRAVTINVQYALVLALALSILTGTTAVLSSSVDNRSESVTESKLNTIAESAASDMQSINTHKNRMEQSDSTVDSIKHKIEVPQRLEDEQYVIQLISSPTETKIAAISTSGASIRVEKQLPNSIQTESATTAPVDDTWIIYNGATDKYRLSTKA